MTRLTNKRVLLGVTGSIAAYKAPELVRALRAAGAQVRVVMSRAAREFVTPLTLQTLSGEPVHEHLLDPAAEATMGHIALARWADVVLVAPATADFVARLAQGRADDLLSAVCLAADVPLVLAPAMNRQMWENAATARNVQALARRGMLVFGPGVGEQACGETGPGRMLEPVELLGRLAEIFAPGTLDGRSVLVTAGPTREAIDPVRFLSNHSSGKMGFAVAAAAAAAGARVILVSGPVALPTPERVERVEVVSAADMHAAVMARLPECGVLIATAAVADYRPRAPAADKLKKGAATLTLELEATPDILADAKARHPRVFAVGFAAETEHLERHARQKLERKGVDMVAANWVGPAAQATAGTFASDMNALRLYWRGGELELPLESKEKLARQLVAVVAERLRSAAAPAGKVLSFNGRAPSGG